MNKIAIAVHGGAGPDSDYVKKHKKEYEQALTEALNIGYKILEEGGTALDAVEDAVIYLEDNPLFNAGRGSALNAKAEVQMDAAIMDGQDKDAGAVCLVKNVKNPISLARAVMEQTAHAYLGESGAMELAQQLGLPLMPDAYFVTDHALEQWLEAMKQNDKATQDAVKKNSYGTVGAVAVDKKGNTAAATSTGGTEGKRNGRIGDTSIIGSGCYADNNTCAVSSTGDGEVIMQHVMAFHVASLMQYKGLSLQKACAYLLAEMKKAKGDVGLIAADAKGNIAIEFTSERMHRGYKTPDDLFVAVYPE